MPIALHLVEPRLDLQQGGGQPPLPLIRVRPAIHLGTPLLHEGIDGFQAIRCFEGQPNEGKHSQPMQGQRLLLAFRQTLRGRLVAALQLRLQAMQGGGRLRIRWGRGQACTIALNYPLPYYWTMARKPRLHVPGGVYHVMLRGNGGQDIFFDAEDRSHLYLLIQQGVERYRHRIHGFCCMPNHLHLVIQVKEAPLSQIMQNLAFRYTRWINTKHTRSGHVFQGRYKAILVEADRYLLELVRYIHLTIQSAPAL